MLTFFTKLCNKSNFEKAFVFVTEQLNSLKLVLISFPEAKLRTICLNTPNAKIELIPSHQQTFTSGNLDNLITLIRTYHSINVDSISYFFTTLKTHLRRHCIEFAISKCVNSANAPYRFRITVRFFVQKI